MRSDSSTTTKQFFETQAQNWFPPFESIYLSAYQDLWKAFNHVWEEKRCRRVYQNKFG